MLSRGSPCCPCSRPGRLRGILEVQPGHRPAVCSIQGRWLTLVPHAWARMSRTRTRSRAAMEEAGMKVLTIGLRHLALTPGCGRVLARLSTVARPLEAEVDIWRRLRCREVLDAARVLVALFRRSDEDIHVYVDADYEAAMGVLRRLDASLKSLYALHGGLEQDDPLRQPGALYERLVFALQLVPHIAGSTVILNDPTIQVKSPNDPLLIPLGERRSTEQQTSSKHLKWRLLGPSGWPPDDTDRFYLLDWRARENAALREGLRGVVEAFRRDALPLLNIAHGRLVEKVTLLERALSMDPSPDEDIADITQIFREELICPFQAQDYRGFEGMSMLLMLSSGHVMDNILVSLGLQLYDDEGPRVTYWDQ
jgi:hypothetical protein